MGRPPIGKNAMTGAERTRRYREKFRHDKPVTKQAGPAPAALVRELAAAKARIAEVEAEAAKWKDELHATLTARFAPKPRAVKPKAEKPPLPPDEERERIIKGLKTRVRNLTMELQVARQWRDGVRHGNISFSFASRSKIMKPLHPDTRKQATEADLDEACRAFTAWLDDLKPRRR